MDFNKIFSSFKKAFHKHPLYAFLTVSIFIHLAVLISVPLSNTGKNTDRKEIFDVDLIQESPPDQNHTPVNPAVMSTPHEHITQTKEDKGTEKPIQPDYSDTIKAKEATVSLYPDNKEISKYSSYLEHLRSEINSAWQYPAFAKEHGLGGNLTLCFSIDKKGRLLDVMITDPSKHPALNSEAVNAIREAAPFNPFPEKYSISKLNVVATFTYQFSGY